MELLAAVPEVGLIAAALGTTCAACAWATAPTDDRTPRAGGKPLQPTASTGPSWLRAALAAAVYVLHPVTLGVLLAQDAGVLLDNALFAVAYAAARSGAWLPAALALAAVLPYSPLQAACAMLVLGLIGAAALLARFRGSSASQPSGAACAQTTLLLSAAGGVAAAARYSWQARHPIRDPLMSLQMDAASGVGELAVGWYLLAEAFSRYLPYFAALVWLFPLGYALPLALRLRRAPGAAVLVALGLTATFDPSNAYCLARFPLLLALCLCDGAACARVRSAWFWLPVAHVPLVAAPMMKHVWLAARMGNANLLFNLQLVYALACGSLLTDFAGAAHRAAQVAAGRAPARGQVQQGRAPRGAAAVAGRAVTLQADASTSKVA